MAISVPVRVDGAVWGALSAGVMQGEFPVDARERMVRFADLASIAIASIKERTRLLHQATTDALTGLPGRRALRERLQDRLATTGDSPTSIALLDIDRFRDLNLRDPDTGDEILHAIAQQLDQACDDSSWPARLGDDEFAWVFPDMPLAEATRRADAFRLKLRHAPNPVLRGVSLSVAVAQSRPTDGPLDLLRRAGEALVQAKAEGGARVVRAE